MNTVVITFLASFGVFFLIILFLIVLGLFSDEKARKEWDGMVNSRKQKVAFDIRVFINGREKDRFLEEESLDGLTTVVMKLVGKYRPFVVYSYLREAKEAEEGRIGVDVFITKVRDYKIER